MNDACTQNVSASGSIKKFC